MFKMLLYDDFVDAVRNSGVLIINHSGLTGDIYLTTNDSEGDMLFYARRKDVLFSFSQQKRFTDFMNRIKVEFGDSFFDIRVDYRFL